MVKLTEQLTTQILFQMTDQEWQISYLKLMKGNVQRAPFPMLLKIRGKKKKKKNNSVSNKYVE